MRSILIVLALTFAGGSALAQQQSADTPKMGAGLLTAFSEYDIDGNGEVATQEFVTLAPAGFEAAARACDTDADGKIAQAEYDACAGLEPTADVAAQPR